MKIFTPLLLLLLSLQTFAQTYPFAEGFEGMPNTQVPIGWGGSMKVLQNHGIGDFKAVCARVSSAVTEDSSVTPLIGPLTSSSALSFYYRIIDQANYPSTPTNLDAGDSIEILLSTNGTDYQRIFLIDMDSHNPTFNFVKKKVYLSQFAGNSVNFKIHCFYGTGASYFVDIDTVVVKNDVQAGIEDVENNVSFSLYPNPARSQFTVRSSSFASTNETALKVYDVCGKEVYSGTLTTANCQLSTVNWNHGLYFVQAGNTTRKLIVE